MITSWDSMSNALYIGLNIQNVLYGIELFLYFETMRILLSNRGAYKKSHIFYAFFSSTMLFLVTVWVATRTIFGGKLWLLDPNFPGDLHASWNSNIAAWYMEWARVAVIILQLMTDALLVYRCRMIWISNRIIVVPIIQWLASLTFGVLAAWATRIPEDFYAGICARFIIAYWYLSVILNTTLTCMICYRVVWHGRTVQKCLGHKHASLYFTAATIIVESALPYTLSGIVLLVSLGVGSPTFLAFTCVYVLMMCISPQLLILRVIAGQAWDNDTFSRPVSTIEFHSGSATGSQLFNNSGARVQV